MVFYPRNLASMSNPKNLRPELIPTKFDLVHRMHFLKGWKFAFGYEDCHDSDLGGREVCHQCWYATSSTIHPTRLAQLHETRKEDVEKARRNFRREGQENSNEYNLRNHSPYETDP